MIPKIILKYNLSKDFGNNVKKNNITPKTKLESRNTNLSSFDKKLKTADDINDQIDKNKSANSDNSKKVINYVEKNININKHEIQILKNKIKDLENQKNKFEIVNKNLNLKIVELEQKLSPKENGKQSGIQLNEVTQNKNHEKIIEEFQLKISNLETIQNEYEIKIHKISFENKILQNKIDHLITQNDIEITNKNLIHQKQIDIYEKNIKELNRQLNEALLENKKNQNKEDNNNLNLDYIENIKNMEQLIISYQDENNKLQKENFLLRNRINNNNQSKLYFSSFDENKDKKDFETLINEKELLYKENRELKIMLEKLKLNNQQLNQNIAKKKMDHLQEILIKDNKIKEYKIKISKLKQKIDELYGNNINKNNEVYSNIAMDLFNQSKRGHSLDFISKRKYDYFNEFSTTNYFAQDNGFYLENEEDYFGDKLNISDL